MNTQRAPLAPTLQRFAMPALAATLFVAVGLLASRTVEVRRGASPPTTLDTAVAAIRAGQDTTALSLLTPLADKGDAKAQYWLADLYENGLGVSKSIPKSVELLGKAADAGFAPAEQRLGEFYLKGDETYQDFAKARTLLAKAAATGDGQAERDLGDIYANGMGVPRDLPEAYGWYENAALHGDGAAIARRDDLLTRMSPTQMTEGEQVARQQAAGSSPS